MHKQITLWLVKLSLNNVINSDLILIQQTSIDFFPL